MDNSDLVEYGRLIKDGELKMRSHEESRNAKTRYVFLFNRGVIFCKATRVMFIYFTDYSFKKPNFIRRRRQIFEASAKY